MNKWIYGVILAGNIFAQPENRFSVYLDSIAGKEVLDFTFRPVMDSGDYGIFLRLVPETKNGTLFPEIQDSLSVFVFRGGKLYYSEVLNTKSIVPSSMVIGRYFTFDSYFAKWYSKNGKNKSFVPVVKKRNKGG